jgi:hypothetical protein
MTFSVNVEYENVDGSVRMEQFEGVVSVIDPPMTDSFGLEFADDRDRKRLKAGRLVKADDEDKNNQ